MRTETEARDIALTRPDGDDYAWGACGAIRGEHTCGNTVKFGGDGSMGCCPACGTIYRRAWGMAVAQIADDHHLHGGDACTFDPATDTCRECGVVACECETCGGVGYHRDGCVDAEGGAS